MTIKSICASSRLNNKIDVIEFTTNNCDVKLTHHPFKHTLVRKNLELYTLHNIGTYGHIGPGSYPKMNAWDKSKI